MGYCNTLPYMFNCDPFSQLLSFIFDGPLIIFTLPFDIAYLIQLYFVVNAASYGLRDGKLTFEGIFYISLFAKFWLEFATVAWPVLSIYVQ